jgi:hypothetical protein
MTSKELEQLSEIRKRGGTNMANRNGVQRVARDEGYQELVAFIDENDMESYSDLLMRV